MIYDTLVVFWCTIIFSVLKRIILNNVYSIKARTFFRTIHIRKPDRESLVPMRRRKQCSAKTMLILKLDVDCFEMGVIHMIHILRIYSLNIHH